MEYHAHLQGLDIKGKAVAAKRLVESSQNSPQTFGFDVLGPPMKVQNQLVDKCIYVCLSGFELASCKACPSYLVLAGLLSEGVLEARLGHLGVALSVA